MAKIENAAIGELDGIPEIPKKRGRPVTGKAATNAQRQAEFRQRRDRDRDVALIAARRSLGLLGDIELIELMKASEPELSKTAWLEFGRRNGWL